MGSGISLSDMTQTAYGVHLGYLTNKTPTGGVSLGTTLSKDVNGGWYANGEINYGMSNQGDNRYGTHWDVSGNINRSFDSERNTFFDIGAGAEVTYDMSYDQNRKYGFGSVPTTYVKSNKNGESVALRYTTQVVPTGKKVNKFHTVDASVSASAAGGIVGNNDSRTYVFGSLSQELTREKNTTGQIGIGYATPGEFMGNDVIFGVKAGYQHNFSGNTSNNPGTHTGAFIDTSLKICF